METLCSKEKFENFEILSRFFDRMRAHCPHPEQFTKPKELKPLLKPFEEIQQKRKLLRHFFSHCEITENYLGNDLRALYQLNLEINHWNGMNLRAVLNKSWGFLDSAKNALEAFQKASSSDIWLSMWRSLVVEQQQFWNMKNLQHLNTFMLCEWIRENATELLQTLTTNVLEGYIQKVLEYDIDGTHMDGLKVKDYEKLLGLLFPNKDYSNQDKDITVRLCNLITKRVIKLSFFKKIKINHFQCANERNTHKKKKKKRKEKFEEMKKLSENQKKFFIPTIVDLQKK
ncbi:hypothetical protein RFI_09645 [Reticulomyxa filosa]|uniref:Uncharacterized protein n=1 Tax=Reticulomyxa filosa TaxID=46433 RepID=X6NNC1_RETFI|nr:hypothetical protein RFI_09645 [Reticulomyxa filosa]|eukprot:ETO27486.1 hypothetical protein RFI_09645 [Reticulomyxa filosa]